jgi:antitoxin (DNA-binding transcriptional repressor) of toxin-antitoxin stability system
MPIVFRTVKDLKERTPQVLKDAQRAHVIITLHGKPQALIRRFTEDELGEAIERSEYVRREVTKGIEDINAGRTVRVGLRYRRPRVRARRA